jgi:hypothetical protein
VSLVLWASDSLLSSLRDRFASPRLSAYAPISTVSSLEALVEAAAADPTAVVFLDRAAVLAVAATEHLVLASPVIAICDEPLQTAILWLQPHPWIAHVLSASMLEHPYAEEHLENVLRTLTSSSSPRLLDWLGPSLTGRRIRLTHANNRSARIERMSEFFDANGVGSRSQQMLRDAAEELLTNAFYDAPVAAKVMKKPVSRSEDVKLPDDSACDLAYGCRDDLAIVRVRDPFGSLTRQRLVDVLTRCARTDMGVEVDESMGGAGLGMWRIFSGASFVGVSVIKDRYTEILVGVVKRAPGPRPFAFHLYFRDSAKRRFWQLLGRDDEGSSPTVNKSVAIDPRAK